MNDQAKKTLDQPLEPGQLRAFLLTHLNRIFCAKTHLYERLPELADQVNFKDLKRAIRETCTAIGKQIARMEEIYIILEVEPSMAGCDELILFIEDGFNPIHESSSEPVLRNLAIIFYMSIIESVEAASFQLLQMVALRLPDKQIRQLLQENYDASKADRKLFMELASIYIN